MFNNKIVSLVYKTILLSLSFIAMVYLIWEGDFNTLGYFTNISNVLVFVFTLIIWIYTLKEILRGDNIGYNTTLLRLKGLPTLMITVTGLIYMFFLADYTKLSNYDPQNLLKHYIIPIMFVLDFFFFDKRGSLKWYHPLIWVFVAAIYIPYIFIRQAILKGGAHQYFYDNVRFPYFFLDIDSLGIFGVSLWLIGIIIIFTAISYLFYLWDYKGREGKHENNI